MQPSELSMTAASFPKMLECAKCGAWNIVRYAPAFVLPEGVDAAGISECKCGHAGYHFAGDVRSVSELIEGVTGKTAWCAEDMAAHDVTTGETLDVRQAVSLAKRGGDDVPPS